MEASCPTKIENSAQFVLKGPSQLFPPSARKRPYRHMGSPCKMTTAIVVVFAALDALAGFFKEGVEGWRAPLRRRETYRTWA